MAIEVEKKYRLTAEQRQQILAKLKELGAGFAHEDFEVNELYGGGILDEKKAVLRVRMIEGKTILTYKERIENASPIKQQIEHETEVADAEALENIIESLGFKRALVYEKRRQTWYLNNIEVLLDELPFGFFMEIEGSEDEINSTERLLEADSFEAEHETYPRLTKNLGKQNDEIIEARFE